MINMDEQAPQAQEPQLIPSVDSGVTKPDSPHKRYLIAAILILVAIGFGSWIWRNQVSKLFPTPNDDLVNVTQDFEAKENIQLPDFSSTTLKDLMSDFLPGIEVKIRPGQKLEESFDVDTPTKMIIWASWTGIDNLDLELINPRGEKINLTELSPEGEDHLYFKEDKKSNLSYTVKGVILSGTWKVSLFNKSSEIVEFGMQVESKSGIMVFSVHPVIGLGIPLLHQGEEYVSKIFIADNGTPATQINPTDTFIPLNLLPLSGVDVTAELFDDESLRLRKEPIKKYKLTDQGDGILGNGIYWSGPIKSLLTGEHTVIYSLSGKNIKGVPFVRVGVGLDSFGWICW